MNTKALARSQKKLSKTQRRLRKLLRRFGLDSKHPVRGMSWVAMTTTLAGALGKVLADRTKLQELIDIVVDAKNKAANVLALSTPDEPEHHRRHHGHHGHRAGVHH